MEGKGGGQVNFENTNDLMFTSTFLYSHPGTKPSYYCGGGEWVRGDGYLANVFRFVA